MEQIEAIARRIRSEFQLLLATTTRTASVQAERPKGSLLLFLVMPASPLASDLQNYLSKRGLVVELITSFAEAERRLDSGLPDLAAVDVSFPEGSSFDFVRALRSMEPAPAIPILLLGERGPFLDKVEAIHCGADGFVPDPPDPAALIRKFKSLLARRRAAAARILAVEDDPSQAHYMEEVLTSAGYQVKICTDPSQFEANLHAFRPQLVLMDILLPGMSGYDLMKFLRQEEGFSTVPAIFLTTEGQRRNQVQAAEAGGDDFLVKPLSPDDLLALVKSRLARHRSIQELMDHDELTGMLAHTPLLKEARLCLNRHSRHGIAYAMVLAQVDRMADQVLTHGSKAHDAVIKGLAKFLQRKIRQTDTMGRYGEKQLAVVLEHLGPVDALRLIRRLQQEFATMDQPIGPRRTVRGTFSAGVAMADPALKTLKEWLDRSGASLQEAVARGGNRTVLFGGEKPEA
jgi:diguanylate cyclase (GGDEF)-like protein